MSSFFAELKRRKVIRVGIAYVVGAWLVLQLTEVLTELLSLPESIGPIVVAIVAIGLPVVLALSWAFELTSEGLKRDSEVAPDQRSSGKVINVLVVGLLLIALAYFVWESRFQGQESEPQSSQAAGSQTDSAGDTIEGSSIGRSIAVLPFESFSEDKANEYFADGLADTLLHKLAQISDLKVIARNSSFQFKGSNMDVREIGAILGVETILEGSVQRAGDQVRIIAQLVRTQDGAHIWSQTFNGSTEDIFNLQDQVASNIVDQFQLSLSAAEKAAMLRNSTDNPEAYDLVIRALNQNRNVDQMTDIRAEDDERIHLLQKAVELDPDYALAWTYLARAWNVLAFASDSELEYDRLVAEAEKAAMESLRLDPALSEAHIAMGWVAHRKGEKHEATRHFRRALELDTNSLEAMSGLALQLGMSDPEESLRLLDRSLELNPTSSIVYRQKHFMFRALGRPEEAIEQLKLAIQLDPGEGMYYNDLVDLLEQQGLPHEGAIYASRLLEQQPDSFSGQMSLAEAWLAVGDYGRAGQWIELLLRHRADSDDGKRLEVDRLIAAQQFQEAANLLEAISVSGSPSVEIMLRMLPACFGLRGAECATQQTSQLKIQLDRAKTQGPMLSVFDFFVDLSQLLSIELSNPDFDSSEPARQLLQNPDAMTPSIFGDLIFARAGLAARANDMEGALAYLEQSLGDGDKFIFNRDVFGMTVESSLLLDPIRGNPGFEDWLARHQAQRDRLLQTMIDMESRGEILSIAAAERMVTP